MDDATTTTAGMRQVEARIGQPIGQYLRDAYTGRELALIDIAHELGISEGTASRWLARFGIQTRLVGHRKTRRTVA